MVQQAMVAAYGISAALRGFCFSILNNRMTRRLRCAAINSCWCGHPEGGQGQRGVTSKWLEARRRFLAAASGRE